MNLFILRDAVDSSERLCNGAELTLDIGRRLVLKHYHASVVISFGFSKPCRYFRTSELTLDCELIVDGKSLARDKFWTGNATIGKILFCAGFPCLTVTGQERERVMVTLSQIVKLMIV